MVEQLSMSCPFPDDKGLHLLSQTEFYLGPILWLSSNPQVIVLLTYNPLTISIQGHCLGTLLKCRGNYQ